VSFTKEEAINRLKKSWKWEEHPPHCIEAQYYFPSEDADEPNYDGIVFIKCWNCEVQDHFLYVDKDNCPECGHKVESVTDLDGSSGGHADQSWHICPECGVESSFQHWVTTPP
jgi:DNA-directed RNA polymerase subunit M/transcription elongation factor TFIIS